MDAQLRAGDVCVDDSRADRPLCTRSLSMSVFRTIVAGVSQNVVGNGIHKKVESTELDLADLQKRRISEALIISTVQTKDAGKQFSPIKRLLARGASWRRCSP